MSELFESFPHLENDRLTIKKMTESDIDMLMEITENSNVYRYIPYFLYKKSKGNLLTAIRNLGERDFDKKKMIIAGIYEVKKPDKLIGLAEMFEYKKRANKITIGYCLNESYWNRGIATSATELMKQYLCEDINIKTLKAFVMPENIYSTKVLEKNGFVKEPEMKQEKNWGGKETVDVYEFTYTAR